MTTLEVRTARPYPIRIGRGLFGEAGALCRAVNGGERALIFTDTNVGPLYAPQLARSLTEAGFQTDTFTFPAGEAHKQLAVVTEAYARLASGGFSRADLIVALGGGVTGDMAGFAAATYLRGIAFVQVPTSLLAMVDSSVGGKTGVDLPAGKNLVGAFWQPALVIVDPDLLGTLPPAYFIDGMAEVVKAACIRDAALFAALESGPAAADAHLEETIRRCIDIKRLVVEHDEREAGERKLLNFGHTLGHALEKYYRYDALSHGRAVAVGMQTITAAAERQGISEPGTAARLAATLTRHGLPIADSASPAAYLPDVLYDKKRRGGTIDLILLRRIGEGLVHPLPLAELPAFVAAGA